MVRLHKLFANIFSNLKFLKHIELPHRGVLILAALCISVVGVTLSYRVKEARMESMQKNPYSTNLTAEAGTSGQILAADERVAAALYETQANLLGALATSSNPFEPSPNDSISDRFTKNILSAYAQSEYSTGDTPADPTTLADQAVNNLDVSNLPHARYTMKDMTLFVPQTNAEIKAYGNLFAQTYLVAIAPVAKNQAYYSTSIGAVGELYRKIAISLLKMKVPSEVAISHLQIVNDFALMADTFPLIDGQEKDPVRALLGLRLVQDSMGDLPQMFVKINKYFKQNGIMFDKTEPGTLWMQVPDSVSDTITASASAAQ